MYRIRILFYRFGLGIALAMLSGCIALYSPEIPQGNILTVEMLDKLKLGMSKRQVRYLLGTPLVQDPFHPQRWDYLYSLQHRGNVKDRQHLSIIFQDDSVVAFHGNALPHSLRTPTPSPSAPAPLLGPP